MQYIEQLIQMNQLQQADVIVLKKKLFGMVDHFVVFLGREQYTNKPLLAANYTKGTKIITELELISFLQALEPLRIERFLGNNQQRSAAVERALSKLGENNYNYFTNNCEHYKNFVQSGISYSKQSAEFGDVVGKTALLVIFGALVSSLFD